MSGAALPIALQALGLASSSDHIGSAWSQSTAALKTRLELALAAGRPLWTRPWIGPTAWTSGETVKVGDVRKTAANQLYICAGVGGVCGATEPTQLDASAVWDGTANLSALWIHIGAAAWDSADDPAKPTITVGDNTTPSGLTQVFPASNTSVFTLRGCSGEVFNTSRLRLRVFNDGVAQRDVPASVAFMSDAPKIGFRVKDLSAGIRVFVDGRPLTLSPHIAQDATAYKWFTCDWASRKPRLYEVMYGKDTATYLLEIAVSTADQVWAYKPPVNLRGAFIGDSYLGGSGYGPFLLGNTLSNHFGRLCGIDDMWNFGTGGTGLLNPGSGPYSTYRGRLAQALALKPDALFVYGSTNDNGYTQTAVTTEALAFLDAIRDATDAPVFWFGPASLGATSTADAGIAAAVAQRPNRNIIYKSMMAATPPWLTGAHNNAAYTWTSNTSQYIGGDGVHPVDKGTMYLAQRMLASYANDLLPLVG